MAQAAAAYERLIDHRPDWAEGYRHLSGALAATGDGDRAIVAATRASDLAPGNFDFAFHAGCLLVDAERVEEAVFYLARALDIEPEHPRVLRALSAAGCARDRPDEALSLALQAAALAPADGGLAIHAGELLLRAGRIDDAMALLDSASRRAPEDPTLWRLISAAESQRDRFDAALAAIGRALALAPDTAEYHLHHGHLLYRVGDFAAAAEAVERATALDPTSHTAQRSRIDVLLAAGRVTDATALGGELLRAFPEDDGSAETVLRVLNRRLDTIDGDYVVLGDRTRRLRRRPRPAPGFRRAAEDPGPRDSGARYSRNPHPVWRFAAGVWLGAYRADPPYRAAVGGVLAVDARTAADRHQFLCLLLHRPDPVFGRKWDQNGL